MMHCAMKEQKKANCSVNHSLNFQRRSESCRNKILYNFIEECKVLKNDILAFILKFNCNCQIP